MATDLEIVNFALSEIGEGTLDSFPENNNRISEIALTHFSRSIDEVLSLYPWADAMERASLASSSFSSSFEYTVGYEIPSDCIKIYSINEDYDWKNSDTYVVEGNYILTNSETPIDVKYTKRIPVASMGVGLINITSKWLAINMCVSLTNDFKLKNNLLQTFEQIHLPRAKYFDASQNNAKRKRPQSAWINARTNRR